MFKLFGMVVGITSSRDSIISTNPGSEFSGGQ